MVKRTARFLPSITDHWENTLRIVALSDQGNASKRITKSDRRSDSLFEHFGCWTLETSVRTKDRLTKDSQREAYGSEDAEIGWQRDSKTKCT